MPPTAPTTRSRKGPDSHRPPSDTATRRSSPAPPTPHPPTASRGLRRIQRPSTPAGKSWGTHDQTWTLSNSLRLLRRTTHESQNAPRHRWACHAGQSALTSSSSHPPTVTELSWEAYVIQSRSPDDQ